MESVSGDGVIIGVSGDGISIVWKSGQCIAVQLDYSDGSVRSSGLK
jgi:hypothetical protein